MTMWVRERQRRAAVPHQAPKIRSLQPSIRHSIAAGSECCRLSSLAANIEGAADPGGQTE